MRGLGHPKQKYGLIADGNKNDKKDLMNEYYWNNTKHHNTDYSRAKKKPCLDDREKTLKASAIKIEYDAVGLEEQYSISRPGR